MVGHKRFIPDSRLKAHRKAIESTYCGRLIAFQQVPMEDEDGLTVFIWLATIYNQPCRVSSQSTGTTTEGQPAEKTSQIRVILPPEVNIPAGSEIKVTQHGVTKWYRCSGEPKHHATHQTIPLTIEDPHA